MPDERGFLAREEFEAAAEFLNTEITSPASCTVCKTGTLLLNGMVANLTNSPRTQGYPLLVLICDTCGHVRLHGAIKAGIVKKKEEPGNAENQNAQPD